MSPRLGVSPTRHKRQRQMFRVARRGEAPVWPRYFADPFVDNVQEFFSRMLSRGVHCNGIHTHGIVFMIDLPRLHSLATVSRSDKTSGVRVPVGTGVTWE